MEKKDYYLGLDLGTTSVGWAVTDTNYNLLRAKRKDLWGIREFDEALTAVDRRTHRISRRRRQREVARIGMVKSYFDEAISAIDHDFMVRLDNSKYHLEDKDEIVRYKYNIFNDEDYTDVEYYKEYPTIYHLRQELIHNFNPDKHDARFVFLAILNMFKHRGHFLNAGLSSDTDERSMQDIYNDFVSEVSDIMGIRMPGDINVSQIEEILSNRKYSRTKKSEELYSLFAIDKKSKDNADKIKIVILNAICGRKINLKNIFEESMNETEEKIEFSFRDSDYDEKMDKIAEAIGDDNYRIIELMKEICDKGSLAGIMHGFDYLSDARAQLYNKHHADVRILKAVFKEYLSDADYEYMFNSTEVGSYSAYVGSFNNMKAGKHRRGVSKSNKIEDLYKKIKDFLKKANPDDERVIQILNDIDTESFLPKQLTASNGIIPNQVHLKEMKKILSNAEKHMTFLTEKDESGLTVSERIIELYKFQIPYYIGPLTERSQANGGNGWVVRLQEGKVLPWNMDKMIDEKATSERFISRMIRNCSYINEEKVLPKASLEYEAYKVLNEINNLKIDGERISVELKHDIYNDLFKIGKKVTKSQLIKYLNNRGLITSDTQLTGIDININNHLSSYGKFKAIFGDDIDNDDTKHMVEDIIKWCTIYGDAKKLLKSTIEDLYGSRLNADQIKRILGYKFKDWGNLSKEFLELEGCDKSDGESKSLIRAMWDNNLNLMELINSDMFTYKEALQEKQTKSLKTLTDFEAEDLDDYYFSAPVKRMIWQTILIIREITKLLGNTPKKIFIEMTRKPDEIKKRTTSRKQKFLDLYKKIKDEDNDWNELIEKADDNGTIRSKKMYLYLLQQGRCMYTGNRIELDNLFNDNMYDIDHIYPRHFVKDDNIDNNLVLVEKTYNAHKSDTYPLEESIYLSQKDRWYALRKEGFINEEKFNRLMGRNHLTEEQKAGFIARQLVETSQGTKGVADIIKALIPETTIVYAKASNVSEFRHDNDFPKSRLINEFHHANDAYLNIVVGNVYHTKFTSNPLNFIKTDYKKDTEKHHYNLSKMFHWNVERNGETAWVAGNDGTIATVKKVMQKNTPLLTRYNFQGHGGIADETLYSAEDAKKGNGYIPLKNNDSKMTDIKNYGGFTNVKNAYFFLVEHKLKNKIVRTFESVPIYLKEIIESNSKKLEEYCENNLGLIDFSIRVRKIKLHSLVKTNGYFAYITGKSNNTILITNAMNLCLDKEWIKYIKKIEKYKETKILDEIISSKSNAELYSNLKDKFYNGIYSKRPNPIGDKLLKKEDKFYSLDLNQQCEVLYNIIQCASIGSKLANLELLNESKSSGLMSINKNITTLDSIYLINQSVTGVYETAIDLLKV